MLGDHPLALPQTSAHAEMDPGRAESRPDERANLRSRGDGPNPKMPITQDIVKPPLTRRWTPRRRGQRGPHRQTSAHAEMDPSWTVFRPARKTNLRSRGDGPVANAILLDSYRKPPLTRRWTLNCLDNSFVSSQTSAHAEMDPCEPSATCRRSPNLRSRGDGPEKDTFDIQWKYKPPLTRRWTYPVAAAHPASIQTSAHAEMDLPDSPDKPFHATNLRSRGDGPSRDVVSSLDDDKPPLTRRWTPDDHSCDCAREQTSAHAEMDPRAAGSFRLGRPNLRSRGDGPADEFFIRRRDFKPPLTRRWTSSLFLSDDTFCQTSAHAEMDPRWARRSPARWPNLRSRGDGPISVMMYLTWFTKPPLTRRWTRIGCGHVGGDFQTSAHAEMDPCDWARPTRPRSNLRSRGDGPRHTDRPLARERKPPLTRRWTYATRSKLRQNGQTSAHAEMDLLKITLSW